MVLERMGYGHVTVHGFRSTFKDWCRDRTRFENYVSEAALAHASGDKIEAAFARSTVLEKRRKLMDAKLMDAKLMDAWTESCAKPAVNRKVVSIRSG
jgi:integrase